MPRHLQSAARTHLLAMALCKDTPVRVGLAAFWQELGVSVQGETPHLGNSAPLSPIRRAIAATPPPG